MTEMQKTPAKRGRKPLPPEIKAERVEIQKEKNRQRQEARRRAALILQRRYADEFETLYKSEVANLEATTKG